MNLLIDIGHPDHVHMFRNAAHIFIKHGHKVLLTCREKEFEKQLLVSEGLEFVSFGKKYKSVAGKIFGLFKFVIKEWRVCLRFKPDILLSHGSPYAAIASWLYRKPHISFEDTYNKEQIRLYKPFTEVILTGMYDHPFISKNEIHCSGYHELLYLHPSYYTPNPNILNVLGLLEAEKYVLVRFIAWNATHDAVGQGFSSKEKIEAVSKLSQFAKVFISSEGELPDELEEYRLKTRPEQIFDVIYYATLIWGESRTIPSEGSVLGTPSVINYNAECYYLADQAAKYDMCYYFSESEEDRKKALDKCVELLSQDAAELKKQWREKRQRLLDEHIDYTAFLVWFVENYPKSRKIMQENPDYQYNFR